MKSELEYELSLEEYLRKMKRLKRDLNFLELEKKRLIQELETEKSKVEFLIKREKVLQTIECYLIKRANILKTMQNVDFKIALVEIENLTKALEEERQKMYETDEELLDLEIIKNKIEKQLNSCLRPTKYEMA